MQVLAMIFLIAGFLFMRLGRTAGRVVRLLGIVLIVQGFLFFFLPMLLGSNP
jgi:hypothetical protein